MKVNQAAFIVFNDLVIRHHQALVSKDKPGRSFLYYLIEGLKKAYPEAAADMFDTSTAPPPPAATPDKP